VLLTYRATDRLLSAFVDSASGYVLPVKRRALRKASETRAPGSALCLLVLHDLGDCCARMCDRRHASVVEPVVVRRLLPRGNHSSMGAPPLQLLADRSLLSREQRCLQYSALLP
jgi:hypothetical protein